MAPGGTDERVSTEFEVWAAERVVAQHDPWQQRVLDRPMCAVPTGGTMPAAAVGATGRLQRNWESRLVMVERELTPTQIRNPAYPRRAVHRA